MIGHSLSLCADAFSSAGGEPAANRQLPSPRHPPLQDIRRFGRCGSRSRRLLSQHARPESTKQLLAVVTSDVDHAGLSGRKKQLCSHDSAKIMRQPQVANCLNQFDQVEPQDRSLAPLADRDGIHTGDGLPRQRVSPATIIALAHRFSKTLAQHSPSTGRAATEHPDAWRDNKTCASDRSTSANALTLNVPCDTLWCVRAAR